MENKIALYKKLHKIQSEVSAVKKDKKAFSFEYVTGNKILSRIKPLMIELGLLLKQEIISVDNSRQDYEVWDKGRKENKTKSEILSKVTMKFTWIDIDTGETDENLFAANGQNDWEKGLGSALTYGERYFLLKYFHIETDKDDVDNPHRKVVETVKEETKVWMNKIKAAKTVDDLLKLYNSNAIYFKSNPTLASAFTWAKDNIKDKNGNTTRKTDNSELLKKIESIKTEKQVIELEASPEFVEVQRDQILLIALGKKKTELEI